ncbi:flagellar hook-length control protein FliK [Prodigiosinella aquatilis]|nr:flagellar hook-length control protein FliK [Prodigiosinella sp. LS101]WJV52164.1 flagellar hook-length control protein FliK [Prodigiosinella sp. LS101]WJV56521.1 flagellar hook-length control protein FliK [Pectobacteriaceae bacterium C111]
MNLPALSTTTNISNTGSVSPGDTLSALLGKDNLPKDFIQLLSKNLATGNSSKEAVVTDSEKNDLLNTLQQNGIMVNDNDLNDLLSAFSNGSISLEDLNSVTDLLSKVKKTEEKKDNKSDDNALAMQALFAMLPTQNTQTSITKTAVNKTGSVNVLPKSVNDKRNGNPALFTDTVKSDDKKSKDDASDSALSFMSLDTKVSLKDSRLQNQHPSQTPEDQIKVDATLVRTAKDSVEQTLALSANTNNTSNAASLQNMTSTLTNVSVPSLPAAQHVTGQINVPVGTQQWNDTLSQQVIMFMRGGQQTAELRLHPEELGSLQISLKLDDSQAQIHLISGNSQVRSALEAALPHLRNAMAESGINLGQSSVGSDAAGWQQAQQQTANNNNSNSGNSSSYKQQFSETTSKTVDPLPIPTRLQSMVSSVNGVDIFA